MDEPQKSGFRQQRDKRARVQRIRTAIVTVISVWMILSIVIISFLCVKMVAMQQQLDKLLQEAAGGETVAEEENQSAGDDDILTQVNLNEDNLAGDDDVRKVYLTFDDGPSDNTDAILDILDDYNVKATFFVVGKEDDASLSAYRRIVAEGHTLGMHSYSHKYSTLYSSLDAFTQDFLKLQQLLYDTTGVTCKFYRFPGGSSNQVSNVDMSQYLQYVNAQGVTYFDWNVSSGDATTQAFTSDELVENVIGDVVKYKTSIVLLHDANNKQATVQALPTLIESLQSMGAVILPIDEDTTAIQHVSIPENN